MLNFIKKMGFGAKSQATPNKPKQPPLEPPAMIFNPKEAIEVYTDNPTDVLHGFINWLSECPNRVYEIGGANPQGHIHTALAKFCEENNLPELSDNWQDKIKKPDHFF